MMWRPVSAQILVVEVRLRRPGPVRPEEGAEWVVERLHVDADEFDAALDDPFGRLFVEPRRIGEVVGIVAVVLVAAGIDHHDVVLPDFRLGRLQVFRRDTPHFFLGIDTTTPVPKKRQSG